MKQTLSIALIQRNPYVGRLAANRAMLVAAYEQALTAGADLAVTSEMALTGYPLEDLVLRGAFQQSAVMESAALARHVKGTPLLTGGLWMAGAKRYNSALWMEKGSITRHFHKHALPNFGVFDEMRHFEPGPKPEIMEFQGLRAGVLVCQDVWDEATVRHVARQKPHLLIVINGSPFDLPKHAERLDVARRAVKLTGVPMVYVNQVGGQDDLVFDGRSFVMNADGEVVMQLPAFEEAQERVHFDLRDERLIPSKGTMAPELEDAEAIYRALVTGLRDYVRKTGFSNVVLGLSGGVDSALVAAIATDALGAQRVSGVMLPSRYTSDESKEDATTCARALGIGLETIPIIPAVEAFSGMLHMPFKGLAADVTEENIQSRIRGVTLMALSNKRGSLLLSTGNKSEMATGYATLYGDMNGAFNPLKDIYKMMVYALCRWRNAHIAPGFAGPKGPVIPDAILTKAPTAELRPGQKDQDSLPPYEVLDGILERLIERQESAETIVAAGLPGMDAATVKRVERMLYLSEYKRRQAAPGTKITRMAFGRDRRYPIANGYLLG
ncbi:NAD+ synthase [bacterium]|nr:NAD+ synthase [bacterium]